MHAVRRRLALIAVVWGLLQVAALAAPVFVLSGDTAVELLCTCEGGDHGVCPLHSESHTEGQCRMTSSRAPLEAALLSIGDGIGMCPERPRFHVRLTRIATVDVPEPPRIHAFPRLHFRPPRA
jgi:hypothetical protein